MKNITKTYWNNEIFQLLDNLEENGVCAFDFDNTLIQNDFGSLVIYKIVTELLNVDEEEFSIHFRDKVEAKKRFKARKDNIKAFYDYFHSEYLWNFNTNGMEIAYKWSSFVFQNFTQDNLSEISLEVFKKENNQSFRIYPAMIELIELLLSKNWQLWIVTASVQYCISAISHYFNIEKDKVLGMKLKNLNGKTTSHIEGDYTFGEGKVKRLKEKVNSYHLSFGDSRGDFELLQNANNLGVFLYNENYKSPNFENVKVQSILHWKKL